MTQLAAWGAVLLLLLIAITWFLVEALEASLDVEGDL